MYTPQRRMDLGQGEVGVKRANEIYLSDEVTANWLFESAQYASHLIWIGWGGEGGVVVVVLNGEVYYYTGLSAHRISRLIRFHFCYSDAVQSVHGSNLSRLPTKITFHNLYDQQLYSQEPSAEALTLYCASAFVIVDTCFAPQFEFTWGTLRAL